MQRAKGGDEHMQEDPDEEEYSFASLVDHPQVPFFAPCTRDVRCDRTGRSSVGPLKALKSSALGLVALKKVTLGCTLDLNVRVLLERRHLAIRKIEA